MADTQVQEGDQVSWQWSGSRPGGEVAEVKEKGELAIESNRGNTIKKNTDPEDPAVHIARPGNDVVKRAHEVEIEEKANGTNGEQANGEANKKEEEKQPGPEAKKPEEEKKAEETKDAPSAKEKLAEPEKPVEEKKDGLEKQNGVADATEETKTEAIPEEPKSEEKKLEILKPEEKKAEAPKTGQKRKAEDEPAAETNGAKEDEEEPATKKQKTAEAETEGKAKGKPGRPKKAPVEKKEKKQPIRKRQPKKAATADGQPRRSGRNKA